MVVSLESVAAEEVAKVESGGSLMSCSAKARQSRERAEESNITFRKAKLETRLRIPFQLSSSDSNQRVCLSTRLSSCRRRPTRACFA